MDVPSGLCLSLLDLDVIRLMHNVGFVRYSEKPIRLKSGIESFVYVFGREDLTDSPAMMRYAGTKICGLLVENQSLDETDICLIGIPTAGTVLAIAAAMVSGYTSKPFGCRIMREVKKGHGAHQQWINGEPDAKHTYWLVDNVATNGDSKIEAAEKLAEDGYPRRPPVLIWIDRQQGAVKRLEQAGFDQIVLAIICAT